MILFLFNLSFIPSNIRLQVELRQELRTFESFQALTSL